MARGTIPSHLGRSVAAFGTLVGRVTLNHSRGPAGMVETVCSWHAGRHDGLHRSSAASCSAYAWRTLRAQDAFLSLTAVHGPRGSRRPSQSNVVSWAAAWRS